MTKIAKFLTLIAIAISMTGVFAEDKPAAQETEKKKDNPPVTLFGTGDLSLSGYGAPVYMMTKIGNKIAHLAGGRGGLIINDCFVVGGGGYGLAAPDNREKISGKDYTGEYPEINMGYGGMLYEYHFSPKSFIHFSVGTLIGAGGLSFSYRADDSGNTNDNHSSTIGNKSFFVLEPEAGVYMNITRWCRLGVLASYRFTKGANKYEFKDKDFRSFNGSVAVEFGWF
jgi:hypothetical protein